MHIYPVEPLVKSKFKEIIISIRHIQVFELSATEILAKF